MSCVVSGFGEKKSQALQTKLGKRIEENEKKSSSLHHNSGHGSPWGKGPNPSICARGTWCLIPQGWRPGATLPCSRRYGFGRQCRLGLLDGLGRAKRSMELPDPWLSLPVITAGQVMVLGRVWKHLCPTLGLLTGVGLGGSSPWQESLTNGRSPDPASERIRS
jgi:hypothetical protein